MGDVLQAMRKDDAARCHRQQLYAAVYLRHVLRFHGRVAGRKIDGAVHETLHPTAPAPRLIIDLDIWFCRTVRFNPFEIERRGEAGTSALEFHAFFFRSTTRG